MNIPVSHSFSSLRRTLSKKQEQFLLLFFTNAIQTRECWKGKVRSTAYREEKHKELVAYIRNRSSTNVFRERFLRPPASRPSTHSCKK